MRVAYIILFSFLSLLSSCKTSTNDERDGKTETDPDALQDPGIEAMSPFKKVSMSIPNNIKPVWGYRFNVSGDFNGDGKREKLMEHFLSGIDNRETNKFYQGLWDYDQLVVLTIMKKPISFVSSDNSLIDTLNVASGGQLLGLSYLKNEGDLNGDGTDEVSYVVDWADWSNLNTWHLVTYQLGQWKELFSFPIWDWQLPALPETCYQYGLFGLERKLINTSIDSINNQLESELLDFKGLVKKIGTNKIQVVFMNDEASLDTMVLDLREF